MVVNMAATLDDPNSAGPQQALSSDAIHNIYLNL